MVGIKGTGMAALAEILLAAECRVTGSDKPEQFYTDRILQDLGIPYGESFTADSVTSDLDLVIHSAAYGRDENPELREARRLGIPLAEYTEALGALSASRPSYGIAGVHGKTTTTALAGSLISELGWPATVLVGSAVPSFGNRSTLIRGERAFVAETCEYRRHFLRFRPSAVVLTSIEADHLDYFRDYSDIFAAFMEYLRLLPPNGTLIYCADQAGACEAAEAVKAERPDLSLIPYGFTADGDYGIVDHQVQGGWNRFRLRSQNREFRLRIPGRHTLQNAAAALALAATLSRTGGPGFPAPDTEALQRGLEAFRGTRRRSEIIGEKRGILFMDDYGHHPGAIRTTLEGLREFYPDKRLIVDFMSHTYSRTEGLLEGFAGAFGAADQVILHKIYASAREKQGRISGRDLYRRVADNHPAAVYFEEIREALPFCRSLLRPGDLFVTMGAGNNWTLGRDLLETI